MDSALPLHATTDWGHVLVEVLVAALVVAVGIALLVGAFTLLHEWRTAR
jgi:Tfp pilus assembly protein PilV